MWVKGPQVINSHSETKFSRSRRTYWNMSYGQKGGMRKHWILWEIERKHTKFNGRSDDPFRVSYVYETDSSNGDGHTPLL